MNSVPLKGTTLSRDSTIAAELVAAYGPKVMRDIPRERRDNKRYFVGEFVTDSGYVIETWVDEHLCAELLSCKPAIK